jgi:pilus assembly protein TadC
MGAGLAGLGPQALGRLESGAQRRQRLALVAAAPLVADLLAASLAAGVTLDRSVPVIARAMGDPARAVLEQVVAHARLGEPADLAWARVASAPGLGVIAQTVARSSRSGAPLAAMLATTAEDIRAEAAAASLAEVRATSVRAVLPLGLCLLPAFVLLGILPVVAGLVPSL